MFKGSVWYRLLLLGALVILPVPAFAIPSLSISSPSADGTFVLRGEQMAGVAGLEIRISYDSRVLSNPRVTMGSLVSGMMSMSNPTNPIKMAIVSTKAIVGNGSGVIATIRFDRTGTSPVGVTKVTASLIDANGKPVAMATPAIVNPDQALVDSPGGGSVDTGDTGDTGDSVQTTKRITPAMAPFVVGGTLTLPDQEGQPEAKTQTAQVESPENQLEREDVLPVPEEEGAAPGEEGAAPEEKAPPQPVTQPKPITSVVERFRQFAGDRTVENLTALFKSDAADHLSQIPAIGISDGKGTVTLLIALETGERAPNFAFNASRYVSLKRAEGGWEVEARPDKGAVKASVTMLYNGFTQDLPLTVTPKAELVTGKPHPLSEADFQLFLKGRTPNLDLNKDGRRDYLDDYIYTANYLVQMEEQAKKKEVAK